MSAGNTNTSGQKKNNHSFQHRNLILLGQLKAISNGLATEATLLSVLNALVAHQDMEILLVRDTGNGDLVVQQIREYDETTQTWITSYQDVSGAPYVPVGPLEYLDPSAVLNLMLTEMLDQGLTLDAIKLDTANLDVALSTRATEATQLLVKAVLDTIKLDTANLDVALSTRASEATLLLTNALLTTIDADTSNLDVALSTRASEATVTSIDTRLTPAVRTHNTVSSSGAGSVPAGSMSGSVLNAGNAAGTWNGISIPAGVSIPWGPIGNRDTYGAIAYDGSGTTLIIEYTT
jgi:hypothetical protein